MRLVTYVESDRTRRAGVLADVGVVDIGEELGIGDVGVRGVLERFHELRPRLLDISSAPGAARHGKTLTAPLEPRRVLGTGLNYRSHVGEMGVGANAEPSANFLKLPGTVCGPGDDVVLPAGALVDYEGEIAAVMGSDGIAGLCLANDVSARDLPTTHITLAKSAPGFCPLGPMIVTLEEVDPCDISFSVSVNGEVRQQAHTSEMIHSVAEIVASYSASLPLLAGDVILTGSPSGVGVAAQPPQFLRPGDTVEVFSPQLGVLINRFVSA